MIIGVHARTLGEQGESEKERDGGVFWIWGINESTFLPLIMGFFFGHKKVCRFGVVLVNFGYWKFEGLGLNWLIVFMWARIMGTQKSKLGKFYGLGLLVYNFLKF